MNRFVGLRLSVTVALVASLITVPTVPALGDPPVVDWTHRQEVSDPNAADDDRLGWSVAIDGETLAVGVPFDHGSGSDRGAVHVFTRDPATGTWTHAQELTDPNTADNDRLGYSVGISGDTIAAGASWDDGAGSKRGAVHVFTRDPATGTWTHEAELTDPTPADSDALGSQVAISGDTIAAGVVGSHRVVHVFTRSPATGTWSHAQELTNPNAAGYDQFGGALAIDADTIAAGAAILAGSGSNRGAVQVFTRDPATGTWTHKAQLTDPNAADDDRFGASVAISGNTIAAGAYGDAGAGSGRGAVHVLTRDPATGTWAHKQELTDPNAADDDKFGASVAISGNTIAAGAYGDAGAGSGRGAVHVLTRDPATGTWAHKQELTDPNAADGDTLGISTAISGDTFASGSYTDDGVGSDRGAVHLFTADTSPHHELTDPNAANGDELGRSVAISGDTIVVGAHYDAGAGSDRRGAAHVFTRNPATGTWTHDTELTDPNAADFDLLGVSVAIDGDTIAAGASGDSSERGAVHVFTRDPATGTWTHTQELTDPNTADDDRLGISIAISGGTIVAGARTDDGAGSTRGAAHVFTRDAAAGTWTHTQELTDPNAADGDLLGYSVAIDGNTIATGAPGDGADRGAVHVFARNPATGLWSHTTELTDPNAADFDTFGLSVAIHRDTIVSGAPYDGGAGTRRGAAHVFSRDTATGTWTHATELSDAKTSNNDWLGWSVAISGDTIAAGAPMDNAGGTDRGVVHVFTRDPATRAWVWHGEARSPTPDYADEMGTSVAISADTVVTGAPHYDAAGADRGTVHTYPLLGTCRRRVATHLGTPFADTLNGATGSDVIVGGDGDDVLSGGDGADLFCTGRGNDTADGGNDNDLIFGETGRDILIGGDGNDRLLGGLGRDRMAGDIGNDTLNGESGNDTLRGGAGSDRLLGGDGDDTLKGQNGDDTLVGQIGDDTLDGGSGTDTLRGSTHIVGDTCTNGTTYVTCEIIL